VNLGQKIDQACQRDKIKSPIGLGLLPTLVLHFALVEAQVGIAKLPSVLRQILEDIPRPPNSASRDD
jgi:hypothetical protein